MGWEGETTGVQLGVILTLTARCPSIRHKWCINNLTLGDVCGSQRGARVWSPPAEEPELRCHANTDTMRSISAAFTSQRAFCICIHDNEVTFLRNSSLCYDNLMFRESSRQRKAITKSPTCLRAGMKFSQIRFCLDCLSFFLLLQVEKTCTQHVKVRRQHRSLINARQRPAPTAPGKQTALTGT